ncbi:GNAT family N-acetyltransferase [Aquibaculum arenosum]|uniref:GNAT family N-acetyltransferase n=1 Tax=Aquibaculum arenosum TaxID=3032591 RepID=A0ABT5YKE6_9PROT|nr:GNAT family N-acetyltransferase [Fodinicurvata sp. CAU 1616]MDF2095420.1 GNAT family N-acetyltransferase [Fodinicurvata sp. CAU 1616]
MSDEIALQFCVRPAKPEDLDAIETLVNAAYAPYVVRLGKAPGPMLEDYAGHIAAGQTRVLETGGGAIAGLLVLLVGEGHLLIDNIAVDPGFQGRGFGRALLKSAEDEARKRGLQELRLYTHELMTENQSLYKRHGWEETERREEAGYSRVYFRKSLS